MYKKLCENYKRGFCLKGESCPYIHSYFKMDRDDNMGVFPKRISEQINWGKT